MRDLVPHHDWKAETAPYYDLTQRMFGVQPSPYMDTDGDRAVRTVAKDMGRPYVRAPLGIYFGTPGVEAADPYFGGVGPRRTGCVSCGNCMIGCAFGAKNKLSVNYLYLAEQRGVVIHDMQEVHELVPLDGGGFRVKARHSGTIGRFERRHHYTAEQVTVAAHAYGTGWSTRSTVLMPGGGVTGASWIRVAAQTTDRDVYAVDLVGDAGRSVAAHGRRRTPDEAARRWAGVTKPRRPRDRSCVRSDCRWISCLLSETAATTTASVCVRHNSSLRISAPPPCPAPLTTVTDRGA